ncbi:hypothetical protein [Aestuariivivens sediminicola]|uniref:hypothetical protein n=1 Tax=Aestuariivivens sediminicola TaxID=2913560 RepID=UPI001F584F52|nr:hypothetical protein [Aestuariivivens sediminicola]
MAKGLKTGGRKKGTPNKVTSSIREWLEKLIDKNRLQIQRDIKALEPKERLQILEKFMQYTIPKMQSVQTKIDFTQLSDEQLDYIINELTKDVKNSN